MLAAIFLGFNIGGFLFAFWFRLFFQVSTLANIKSKIRFFSMATIFWLPLLAILTDSIKQMITIIGCFIILVYSEWNLITKSIWEHLLYHMCINNWKIIQKTMNQHFKKVWMNFKRMNLQSIPWFPSISIHKSLHDGSKNKALPRQEIIDGSQKNESMCRDRMGSFKRSFLIVLLSPASF